MPFLPLNVIASASPILIAAYFSLSLLAGWLGRKKIMGFWGYFFGSILLSPIVGILLVLVSGTARQTKDKTS
jgi:uncharacterized membrane protein YvlD (DUF360 family)